jgi:SAM-dependent methyltransferase
MCVIPSTSHDYKLVILSVPLALVQVRSLEVAVRRGMARALPAMVLLLVLLLWIGRSYAMLPVVLGNRYPAILLFQVLVMAFVIEDGRSRERRQRLQVLRASMYPGVGRDDPIRFYRLPVIGGLYRKRVELCLDRLPGGQRVLEVGFGSGVTFPNLAELYDEIWGLDPGVEVEVLEEFWRARGITTSLRRGSILDMPLPESTFDAVLLISILEHLRPQDQMAAFREVRRVLVPGGTAIYGVPVERGFMLRAFRILGYDIRQHHLSTENDVRRGAVASLAEIAVTSMPGVLGIPRAIYQVGVFRKE